MKAKCCFERKSENPKERAPSLGLGFWIAEVAHVGHRKVKEQARGGAPPMEEAHNKCQVTREWQMRRGAHFLEEGRHMGERKGCGLHPMLKWSFRKGAPHL
jgi:hypothetical protein